MTATATLPIRRTDSVGKIIDVLDHAGLLRPTALMLDDPDMPMREYEKIGHALGRLHDASKWWIADWLLFGEALYGDEATQVAAVTQRSEKTLLNYRWIASRVVRSRRRAGLSFTHHEIVAPLEADDQAAFLDLAEKEKLPSRELRLRVDEWKAGRQQSLNGGDGGDEGARQMVVEEVVREAERVYKAAQIADGEARVPAERMLRLGVVLGYGDA